MPQWGVILGSHIEGKHFSLPIWTLIIPIPLPPFAIVKKTYFLPTLDSSEKKSCVAQLIIMEKIINSTFWRLRTAVAKNAVCVFYSIFWGWRDWVSYSSDQPHTHYVVKAGLETSDPTVYTSQVLGLKMSTNLALWTYFKTTEVKRKYFRGHPDILFSLKSDSLMFVF